MSIFDLYCLLTILKNFQEFNLQSYLDMKNNNATHVTNKSVLICLYNLFHVFLIKTFYQKKKKKKRIKEPTFQILHEEGDFNLQTFEIYVY